MEITPHEWVVICFVDERVDMVYGPFPQHEEARTLAQRLRALADKFTAVELHVISPSPVKAPA